MDFQKDSGEFDPRDRRYRWKLWVRVVGPELAYWHVYWTRIAAFSSLLAIAGWLVLAAGAWSFLKYYRDYRSVEYRDLALFPWRSDHFREGLARFYLASGREEIDRKNYREGYLRLLAGLRWIPADLEARRTVATMQVRFGLPHRALDTLVAGVPYYPNLEYLKLLFGWLLEATEDERVLEVARRLLPERPDGTIEHQFVALQAATAHFERGRYDQAEAIVQRWGLPDSLEGQILLAKCDWERGLGERAAARLEAQATRFANRDELYVELLRFERALGRTDQARRFAVLRHLNTRDVPASRLDLLATYHATNDAASEARETEAFILDFGADPEACNQLARYAVQTAQPALLARADAWARVRHFSLRQIDLARIQLALGRQEYRTALALADAAIRESQGEDSDFAVLTEGLRAIALFGAKDAAAGDNALHVFLTRENLRASDALYVAAQLRLLGIPARGREILERACVLEPLNQSCLTALIRIEVEQGDRAALAESLPKFLKMRKPSRALLEETLARLDQPEDVSLRDAIREVLPQITTHPLPPG